MTSNLLFCAACYIAVFVVMCRLAKMDPSTKVVILSRYVVWGGACAVSGLLGLFAYYMPAAYCLIAAFVIDLALGIGAWSAGQPRHAVSPPNLEKLG